MNLRERPASERGPGLNILLVEDDDVDVMSVQRACRGRPVTHCVTVARDGREALAILRGEDGGRPWRSPYVILLDLNLPLMNGLEFLRELRRDPEHGRAVVFVLTTSEAERDRQAAYDQHVAGYVVKSTLGHDFGPMLDLLERYQRVVSLP
jgi:CheY-like chemotaxis protein